MKRYIKSDIRWYSAWEVEGEFEDGFVIRAGGSSETAAFDNLFDKAEALEGEHGELIWYGYSNDEHYYDGEYIEDEEDW